MVHWLPLYSGKFKADLPKKTVAFHFEFGGEIIEQARYEVRTLYSFENLRIANKALDR